ncbi:hypothetical protein GJ744_012093 [Endocarpon pusillum]|uniref:Uncharacterized protein n=1 Tax=Endocarpon pusillum TaxID=364733 RepID=A0A8H7AJI3_9EURO|nr:hypothetical protein GJ744_012093 [Endocarpon pusillum]
MEKVKIQGAPRFSVKDLPRAMTYLFETSERLKFSQRLAAIFHNHESQALNVVRRIPVQTKQGPEPEDLLKSFYKQARNYHVSSYGTSPPLTTQASQPCRASTAVDIVAMGTPFRADFN